MEAVMVNPSDRFEGAAREIAAGTSRRRALGLLAASVAGGLVALFGAAPAEAERCRRTGESCREGKRCCTGVCCGGVCCAAGQVCQSGTCVTPPPPGGPNLVRCFCGDGSTIEVCADIACDSGAAQDTVCGPACAAHGGEVGTGCLIGDPACAA
jgi:hypothetical protein